MAAAEPKSKKSATIDATEDFEEPRFLCCFQRMHVRTAATVVAALELLLVLGVIPINMTLGIIMLVISVAIISLLFWAIYKNNALLIIPHLIWQGVQALILVSYFLFALIAGSMYIVELSHARYQLAEKLTEEQKEPGATMPDHAVDMLQESDKNLTFLILGFFLLLAYFVLFFGLNFWWFFVIRRFYEYLKIHGGPAAAKIVGASAAAKVSASAAAKVSASAAAKNSASAAGKNSASAAAKNSASAAVGKDTEE